MRLLTAKRRYIILLLFTLSTQCPAHFDIAMFIFVYILYYFFLHARMQCLFYAALIFHMNKKKNKGRHARG